LRDENFLSALRHLEPDIICVIAFRIIPRSVYSLAKLGAFNVHGSLLPKYRGAAPVHHAIINGEKQSGVTSFLLNDVVDTGSVLLSASHDIADGTTAGELYAALMPLAATVAVDTVELLTRGEVQPLQQDESMATAAPKVWRDLSSIPWDQSCVRVQQFILGLSPQPCAWTMMDGERIKVYRARCVNTTRRQGVGEWSISEEGWLVGCADGVLRLDEIQIPGKPPMKAEDFVRGWRGARHGVFTHS
jgi:methionyl-tRNA formyltransferase